MSQYERIRTLVAQGDYNALIATVPYAVFLGIQVDEAEREDERLFRMSYRDALIGNMRKHALHGGTLAGFLELASSFEVLITQSQAHVPRPIDYSIDYLRSARAADCLADCRVLRQGRRVAQVQAYAWQDDRDRPIAFARADFMLQDV